MKIDAFTHIFPQKALDRLIALGPEQEKLYRGIYGGPALSDLDQRFRLMDAYGDYRQVIALSGPPIEAMGPPAIAREMARLANDEMAALVARHPDRFAGFVASLPANDPDAMLDEAGRAIRALGALGVQLYSNINGAPVTAPEMLPLFDLMAALDRPIWLHPERVPDATRFGRDEIWFVLGWPIDTSIAMAEIVFAGIFDKHPNIKIIAHQMGGIVPMLEGRIAKAWNRPTGRLGDEEYGRRRQAMAKKPIDYFRMFYADTAVGGGRESLRIGLSFFGADRVLFATDVPFGPDGGRAYADEAIANVESCAEREAIFAGNLRRLVSGLA